MTNREKFKEVFGFIPNDDECMCPTDYVDCMGGVLVWFKKEHKNDD